jgi:hypothetical protein
MIDIAVNDHQTTRTVLRCQPEIKRLLYRLDGRGYIAGSYAAYACNPLIKPMEPGDIDIFATTDQNAAAVVDTFLGLHCYRDKAGIYFVDAVNDIVTTLRKYTMRGLPIQVIRPSPEWKQFPEDLINSFDLDVCRAVIISPNTVLCDEHAGWDQGKVLRVNNPLRTFKRILKYNARGVEFSDHELLKVFRAWDEMPAEKKEGWIKEAADAEFAPEFFDSSFTDEDDWFEGE